MVTERKINYAGFDEGKMRFRVGSLDIKDFASSLHNHIRAWDPDMRNPFTAEVVDRISAGEKIEYKRKILSEVNLNGSTETTINQRVVRLVDDISLHYFRLYIGERRALNTKNAMYSPLGLTICDKQELQALRDIFTSDEVARIISGNKNRKRVVKEIGLKGSLEMEKAPRVVRMVDNGDYDFSILIGEKRVLDSKKEWHPRNIPVSKNELLALKSLFENQPIK